MLVDNATIYPHNKDQNLLNTQIHTYNNTHFSQKSRTKTPEQKTESNLTRVEIWYEIQRYSKLFGELKNLVE